MAVLALPSTHSATLRLPVPTCHPWGAVRSDGHHLRLIASTETAEEAEEYGRLVSISSTSRRLGLRVGGVVEVVDGEVLPRQHGPWCCA